MRTRQGEDRNYRRRSEMGGLSKTEVIESIQTKEDLQAWAQQDQVEVRQNCGVQEGTATAVAWSVTERSPLISCLYQGGNTGQMYTCATKACKFKNLPISCMVIYDKIADIGSKQPTASRNIKRNKCKQ